MKYEKVCTKCNTLKNVSEFTKCSKKKDGYEAMCGPCLRETKRAYYHTSDKYKARSKKYNEINYEKIKASVLRRHLQNPNKRKNSHKQYREKNKEALKIKKNLYYINNKELRTRYNRNPITKYKVLCSNAKSRKLSMHISLDEYLNIYKSGNCFYCLTDITQYAGHSLDRVDSDLGYTMDNVVLCCPDCNRIKLHFKIEQLVQILPKMLKNLKKLIKKKGKTNAI